MSSLPSWLVAVEFDNFCLQCKWKYLQTVSVCTDSTRLPANLSSQMRYRLDDYVHAALWQAAIRAAARTAWAVICSFFIHVTALESILPAACQSENPGQHLKLLNCTLYGAARWHPLWSQRHFSAVFSGYLSRDLVWGLVSSQGKHAQWVSGIVTSVRQGGVLVIRFVQVFH